MPGRYSVEDLLKLRASPLICKPSGLPPPEEWMGIQETATKRPTTRGRQEDTVPSTDGYQKRPAFETSQRKSTADPERIVLGPPRRSFASSNGKPFGRQNIQDAEDGAREKTHEKNRTGEELEGKIGERRGITGAAGRHNNRHDQDGGYQERSRRRYEEEEGESKGHRDHDRHKWGSREIRDERILEEDGGENGNSRTSHRRDQGRSKFDQPWFRSDKPGEDSRRDTDRNPAWRHNKTKDGEWDTPGKVEVDPEWMDSVENSEPFQAHTQEDFQRWKERMKAGNSTQDVRSEPSKPKDLSSTTEQSSSMPSGSNIITPDPSGNSMDKFFARFSGKKTPTEDIPVSKPASKTRFASIFSPQAENKAETPLVSHMQTAQPNVLDLNVKAGNPDSAATQPHHPVDADQAGFQRILQMLGKRETSTILSPDASKGKLPNLPSAQSHQRHASPDLVALFKQEQPARQTPPVAPPGFERLLDSRSPSDHQMRQSQTPNKDELLLNLLRQAEISAKPQPQQSYHEHLGPPGLFPSSEQTRNGSRPGSEQERPQMQERPSTRSLFDDPAISGMSYSEEMRARDGAQRRQINVPPPGYDAQYMDNSRSNPTQQSKMHSMPPGLQRPPGLDQMSRLPPGWSQQQGSQGLPPQSRPGPPPGLGPRGMPPFGNPAQPPMPPQISGQGQARPPSQRKYTGDSNPPAFPPGMGPPPGFMSHGPPPGFHHASAAQVAQNYGRFAMGGAEQTAPQQGPPPAMGRGYMDMYSGDRGGMRGGNGVPLPPGFR